MGHVGVIMSSYKGDDESIYNMEYLNVTNVCELIRMSVHKDYRGRKIGKRLCETVESYALSKGMKQIVLNTLSEMRLARRLYESCGFHLVKKSKLPEEEIYEPDKWDHSRYYIVHYTKLLKQ